MNWFKHDASATQDAKLKKLIIRHGAVGYAIYFHCLELIAGDVSETNITFELEHDSEIIAENLHIRGSAEKSGMAIVEEIMRTIIDLELFQETGGRVFCYKLLKRLDLSMTSNPQFRALITQAKEGNHDAIMTHHDSIMRASKQASKNSNQDEQEEKKADKPPLPTEAVALASLLFTLHQEKIDKGKKRPSDSILRTWAEDIDKLNRIDGRPWEDIEKVIRWVKDSNFWAPNIQSGSKLREKFDTVYAQMLDKGRGSSRQPKVTERIAFLDMEEE